MPTPAEAGATKDTKVAQALASFFDFFVASQEAVLVARSKKQL
jgi:hypothetical protein